MDLVSGDDIVAGIARMRDQLAEQRARAEHAAKRADIAEARAERSEALLAQIAGKLGISFSTPTAPASEAAEKPLIPGSLLNKVPSAPTPIQPVKTSGTKAAKIDLSQTRGATAKVARSTEPARPAFGLPTLPSVARTQKRPSAPRTARAGKLKQEIVDGIKAHPGLTWDQLRTRLRRPDSPLFRKYRRELIEEGICSVRRRKVYPA